MHGRLELILLFLVLSFLRLFYLLFVSLACHVEVGVAVNLETDLAVGEVVEETGCDKVDAVHLLVVECGAMRLAVVLLCPERPLFVQVKHIRHEHVLAQVLW